MSQSAIYLTMNLPLEMRETYLQRRRVELEQFKIASGDSAFQLAKKVGHQLKGNAKSFDFEELSAVAKSFENSAQSQDANILALAITQYENILDLCAQRLALEKTVSNK